MKLLRDNVLIEPEKEKKLSDIIELPEDTEIKPPCRGLVIACGPGCTEVRPGQLVHFEQFDWCVAPGECIIIRENEIIVKET